MQRLRTILRLQRDEFLPLRVIRQELAAGRADGESAPAAGARGERRRAPPAPRRGRREGRRRRSTRSRTSSRRRGADPKLVRELEEYGVIKGEQRAGVRYYDETEREIVRAVTELARYGVAGRNLRVFRTSADREAALLQQILAPALRSRNPERRKEAVETLENLAAVATLPQAPAADPRPAQRRRLRPARARPRGRCRRRASAARSPPPPRGGLERRRRPAPPGALVAARACGGGGRRRTASRRCSATDQRQRRARRLPAARDATRRGCCAGTQELEGTPFERLLAEAETAVELAPADGGAATA